MATDFLNTPFMTSIIDTCSQIYQAGWAENHAGNLSYLLTEEEIEAYIGTDKKVISSRKLEVPCPNLSNKYFLVTAAGSPFKNIIKEPDKHLGIIQINEDGSGFDIIWGFRGNKRPTSELPTHLLCHSERLEADDQHRIVLHCHPDYTIAMTFMHELDQNAFTKTMWSLNSECVLVFPEGLGLLPWMVCGNGEIGMETAGKMKEFRIVIWPHHGILAAGQSVDQALGLIETIEKAARVYVVTDGKRKQCMTEDQIIALADAFHLNVRKGIVME
ncbi:rhamnulose-1-phosphate aldolase [Oceanobacillus sp. CFH 90083]|uniref:rhamnulose-1-phosphate aldolase n=1 Tax=Oceanobacillus sp. CFH 90083 TaxID=2592336 RepID=UPI00128D59B2|nr:rhamnulose-1-phosphate aldolase [Oceanobacillus sp. CFH 90083]